jgi:hypothetical protein
MQVPSFGVSLAFRLAGHGEVGRSWIAWAVSSVLGPLIWMLYLYGAATLEHVAIRLLGGKGSWSTTFRGAAFTLSVGVLGVVPWLGLALVPVVWAVYRALAYRALHELSPGRSAAALVLSFTIGGCGFSVFFVALYEFFSRA